AITILLPCKDQQREFFLDAVGSVVRQSSPHWILLVLTDPNTPPEITDWADSFGDPRIEVRVCPETGFANALNHGLRQARTEFVCSLLSDDRLHPDAIRTLLSYRRRVPEADFLHSARRHIDAGGRYVGGIAPTRVLRLDEFRSGGSPVKHLMCWRREMAL